MKKISFSLLMLFFIVLVSCNDKEEVEALPLDQKFGFTVDGKSYFFSENDSTEVQAFPALEQNFFYNDTANYLQTVRFHVGRSPGSSAVQIENIIIHFTGRFLENQFVDEGQFCKKLEDNTFEDFFENSTWSVPGKFDEVLRHEDRSFYASLLLDINGKTEWTSSPVNTGMPNDIVNQNNSFVVIDSVKAVVHPERGEGLMLYGRFEINILSPMGDSTRMENGYFKICAPKC
jgi:hypothetical protein